MANRKANYSWLTLVEVWSQILRGEGSLLFCSALVSIVWNSEFFALIIQESDKKNQNHVMWEQLKELQLFSPWRNSLREQSTWLRLWVLTDRVGKGRLDFKLPVTSHGRRRTTGWEREGMPTPSLSHWMGAWRDAYPFPSPLSGSMKGCISLFSWPEAKTPGDTLLFGKCHALSKIGSRNCAGAETWLSEAVMFPTLWAALGSCEEILLISVFWGLFSRLHLLLASLSFFQQDVSMPSFTLVWDFCIKC